MTNQQPQYKNNIREKFWHDQHDAALSRLIHDVGFEIAGELVNGKPRVVDAVVSQMQSGAKPYELNFAALGATDAQIVRINAHQAERRELDAAHSELIKATGLDVARELVETNPKVDALFLAQTRSGATAGEIDFKALGATDEQLGRISQHQAARRELEEAAKATVQPASFADRIGADEVVRDIGGFRR